MENNSLSSIIELLPQEERNAFFTIHNHAVSAGFTPFITKSLKKNFSKIEYRLTKNDDMLFAVQINSGQWSLRCKLFNLHKYTTLLNDLNESVLKKLLESKECKGNGCTAGIKFEYDNQRYNLCRHLIRLRNVCQADVPSIWLLLQAESKFRP